MMPDGSFCNIDLKSVLQELPRWQWHARTDAIAANFALAGCVLSDAA